MLRFHRMVRRDPSVRATADAGRGEKRLFRSWFQAIFTSNGMPFGEFRLMVVIPNKRGKGLSLGQIQATYHIIRQST